MPAKYLMSLDLGGSGGRATLYNWETNELYASTCAWGFDPDPSAGGYAVDLGCEAKWNALCAAGRDVLGKAGAGPQDIAGISTTSMRHGTVLLGKDGRVLMATPNNDARAISESIELQGARGDELYQRTGHIPNPVIMASRLLWVKNNHPEMLDQAAVVLTISDWMAYRLSGMAVSEPSQAGETCLFDLEQSCWAEDIIASLDLPVAIFPRIVIPGTKIGGLTEQAAAELGLQPGIPVGAGGADTQLGLLALGVTTTGQLGVVAGSTAPVMATTATPKIDPNKHTWSGMHVVPGVFIVESNAGGMGTSLEWLSGLLYSDSPLPVAALSGDAAKCGPGAGGVISTLGAQVFNASALGIPIDGLTFSTMIVPSGKEGRARFARAALEGMAFGMRANAEQALAVAGTKPDRVYIAGGMTRSDLLMQISADAFNLPLTSGYGQSATGFGAVICAAVAAGLYPDLVSAATGMIKNVHQMSTSANAETYQELYQAWNGHRQQRAPADEIAQGAVMQAMQAGMGGDASQGRSTFRPRIYVSANAGEEAIRMLRELGDVTYASYAEAGNLLSGDEMVETIKGYQVLVTEVDLVDADVLKKAADLRVVFACRGNPVNVDIPACTAAGIPVINTPGRNSDAVADLAVGFMLMLARKLDKASAFLREPGGEAGDMGRMGAAYFNFKGSELWHKTVGLIGGGAIGHKVTRRVLPFEARVLVFDPYLSAEEAALMGAVKVGLDELLAESDFVSLHAPVNEETSGMINAAAFAQMKEGAYLINTARAALIDNDALIEALSSGKLGGAAFDVFPVEPPGADDPLLAFENVIATPHIGGNTGEVGIHQGAIIVEELQRLLAGQRPRFALNPEVLDGFNWTGIRQANASMLEELAKGPGPGMTDLDLKAKQEQAIPAEKAKSGGLLKGLKSLVGRGKEHESSASQPLSQADSPAAQPAGSASKEAAEAQFSKVLEKFLSDLSNDPSAHKFAEKNKVSFQFVMKGTAISFYMGYNGGVTTGLGEPPFKPDVTIKTDPDTFDGMFTGRIDGNQAFKSGKLSVSGNMLKAMAMQKLDFGAVYARVRDEMGSADYLAVLSGAPQTAPAPAPASQTVKQPEAPASPAAAPSFEKFNQLMEQFLQLMEVDPDTQIFAKGKNVTFQYILKDAGTSFYMSFIDGLARTGMGKSPMKADVTIKSFADTLDGMFSGRLDGNQAFKTGKLSVSGNMMKAMAMQKLNFGKLYNQARAEIGDPGVLTAPVEAKPSPAKSQAPADSAQPAQAAAIAAPVVIHKVGDIRDTILEVNNELYLKSWITSTGGNISARSESNPNEIWITPSAIFKGDLRADFMVKIDLEGNIIGGANFNASSERKVHCAVYQSRPEIKAVVHTHAPFATLMALTGSEWLPISADAAFFGQIPVVPFIMPGSSELGEEVSRAMGAKGFTAIMQNHGLVVAGTDLRRAADMTEMIEITAEKLLWCRKLGVTPALLPEDIVDILKEMGSAIA